MTKFADVDSLLEANHNHHTEFRFSLNTHEIISQYEKGTASMQERLTAAKKVAAAGYPLGFLIAPIITYYNWKSEYSQLISDLVTLLPKIRNKISCLNYTPTSYLVFENGWLQTHLDSVFLIFQYSYWQLHLKEHLSFQQG